MFGGNDDNDQSAQDANNAPKDDTLSGVKDLTDDASAASPAVPAFDSNSFMSTPPTSPLSVPATDQHHQTSVPPAPAASLPASDDLLDLKQQALQQLSPLIGHLDQSPEEKFRTTMMLIQASDNQSLLKDAYDAAQQITDEKVKAQALLDVVNEINYFTQRQNEQST